MRHINVALFVPDEGCPHRCSFCNQKTISGKTQPLKIADIDSAVETALSNVCCNEGEIAFFGGSFTAIDREYMISLLQRAKMYIDQGFFKGVRISTRPDYIDDDVLSVLKEYGVTSIELGCQSMCDRVLMMNGRGHTSEDVVKAAKLIKKYGFEFGVQMMTGLYADTNEQAVKTAEKLIALKPDTARIYPTVVLENTELCRLYREGKYMPQSTEEAVELCAELLMMFQTAGVRVIRLGLHSGGNVEEGYVAGAYHPAFRELVESRIYYSLIEKALTEADISRGEVVVTVGKAFLSMAVGQKKSNVIAFANEGYNIKFETDENYKKYEVSVRLTK